MNLFRDENVSWNHYIDRFTLCGYVLNLEENKLVWSWNKVDGIVMAKDVYDALVFGKFFVM